ncbi:hypothetical protein PAGU2638_12870 [Lysobacter sp. PAGU 2638]
MAARIATLRADAVMGNQDGVRREADAMQDDLRRSMKLPDAGRPIDREAARVAVKRVQGVHSVVWVDRSNLLVLVDGNEQRTMGTIDAICRELDPLGDTLAVVVHLQSRVARTGDELETVSRNCQLAEGDRALLQERRQLDVLSPEIRAEHAAQQHARGSSAVSKRKADEAARLIESSTPEM